MQLVVFGSPATAGTTLSVQLLACVIVAVMATWPPGDVTDAGLTVKPLTVGFGGAGAADCASVTVLVLE